MFISKKLCDLLTYINTQDVYYDFFRLNSNCEIYLKNKSFLVEFLNSSTAASSEITDCTVFCLTNFYQIMRYKNILRKL
jgi:hypothetical protein